MALEDVQNEGGPALGGQPGEDGIESRQAPACVGGTLRVRAAGQALLRDLDGHGAFRGAFARAQGDANGDAQQPGGKRGLAAKTGEGAKGVDEGHLHEILEVGGRARQTVNGAVDASDMQTKQLPARRLVARAGARDQIGDLGRIGQGIAAHTVVRGGHGSES